MKQIYLDNAASTPIDKEILREMEKISRNSRGNPSSLHSFGREANNIIEKARRSIAVFLDCALESVIFTRSATEADNLAVLGVIKKIRENGITRPHIITTKIEHSAVLNPCHHLEKEGRAEVDYISPNKDGAIDARAVEDKIKENTALISVIYANNETGVIQPIPEIGKIAKKKSVPFHTDAAQAAGYLDCRARELRADFITLSAHKIYGPKGAGALFVKDKNSLLPLIYGGGQEFGIVPGTENVPAIAGMGRAIEIIKKNKKETIKMKNLRNWALERIIKEIPGAELNGSREKRLPNNINISLPGAEGEAMITMLDEKGIAVSTGSACSAKDLSASHTLLAMGLSEKRAHSSLRITLGKQNTKKEIDIFINELKKIVKRLREISGYNAQ